jgi:hypothetical protein
MTIPVTPEELEVFYQVTDGAAKIREDIMSGKKYRTMNEVGRMLGSRSALFKPTWAELHPRRKK